MAGTHQQRDQWSGESGGLCPSLNRWASANKRRTRPGSNKSSLSETAASLRWRVDPVFAGVKTARGRCDLAQGWFIGRLTTGWHQISQPRSATGSLRSDPRSACRVNTAQRVRHRNPDAFSRCRNRWRRAARELAWPAVSLAADARASSADARPCDGRGAWTLPPRPVAADPRAHQRGVSSSVGGDRARPPPASRRHRSVGLPDWRPPPPPAPRSTGIGSASRASGAPTPTPAARLFVPIGTAAAATPAPGGIALFSR